MPDKILLPMVIFPEQCAGAAALLRGAGYELVENRHRPFELARHAAHFADIVGVVCGSEPWTAQMMDCLPRLRVLSRFGTGTDNIDLAAAAARGVVCTNTPGANSGAVAEHALALMLELTRRPGWYAGRLRAGIWEKRQGGELCGKTVGLVGFGAIARRLAGLLQGFEVRLLACDPRPDQGEAARLNVTLCSLEELLAQADLVSLHLPAAPDTRHLIGEKALERMKPGAMLVNTARGSLVDSAALYRALRQGRLAGAALDVFETEPLSPGEPLLALDNFVGTPHVGGATAEANRRTGQAAAQNLLDALAGRPVRCRVG